MFEWIYKKFYLASLGFLAKYIGFERKPSIKNENQHEEVGNFDAIDQKAIKYGNTYRGMGVAVGLLGFTAIFLEIFPSSFAIANNTFSILGSKFAVGNFYAVFKLICMIGIGVLVLIAIYKDYKNKWMNARLKAEELRYCELSEFIIKLQSCDISREGQVDLVIKIRAFLDKKIDDQISYNENAGKNYQNIVSFCGKVTWIGFIVSIVLGSVNFLLINKMLAFPNFLNFPAQYYIAFFASLIPTLIATLNGINAFLKLNDLAKDQLEIAKSLRDVKEVLANSNDSGVVLNIAKRAYSILSHRDIEWFESTGNQAIKPA